jgi:hypothetical protein
MHQITQPIRSAFALLTKDATQKLGTTKGQSDLLRRLQKLVSLRAGQFDLLGISFL